MIGEHGKLFVVCYAQADIDGRMAPTSNAYVFTHLKLAKEFEIVAVEREIDELLEGYGSDEEAEGDSTIMRLRDWLMVVDNWDGSGVIGIEDDDNMICRNMFTREPNEG